MKKRVFSLALLAVMVLSLTAQATEWRAVLNKPILSISGTTATCKVDYKSTSTTDTVKVTLALWCGENIVDSWTDTGTGKVVIEETCRVVEGNTYTLVMMPVINGVAKPTVSVTANS